MAVTTDEVRHIAKLARLRFADDETAACTKTLSQILTYVEQLQEVDTRGIEPTSHAVDLELVMRPDSVQPVLSEQDIATNAPDLEDGQFRVPKIVEGS